METFETQRLIIRELTMSDAKRLSEYRIISRGGDILIIKQLKE